MNAKQRAIAGGALDVLPSVVAFFFAYFVTDGFLTDEPYLFSILAVTTALNVLFTAIVRDYMEEWRVPSVAGAVRLASAYTMSLIITLILDIFLYPAVPVSLILIYFYVCFTLAFLLRLIPHFVGRSRSVKGVPIIIYGAGYTGATLIKSLKENNTEFRPVAAIDDDEKKKGKRIQGVPIVGGFDTVKATMDKFGCDTVAVAISRNVTSKRLIEIYGGLKALGANVKSASLLGDRNELIPDREISLKNFRTESLLRRVEHKIDSELVHVVMSGRVVMITGGAGSIGSEICRQALLYGCSKLVIFDCSEYNMFTLDAELKEKYAGRYDLVIGSVRDYDKVEQTVKRYGVQVIFHTAAYKHVPMMEISAAEAVKTNVIGTENVINAAKSCGVDSFILISTDKAINPSSVMGATKRVAELILQEKAESGGTKLSAVRFGNVLGSSGSVIPTFLKQISEGKNLTVTHKDMKRYFMTIPEAVSLVVQAGGLARGGEVFVLDMGKPVLIRELAEDIIRLSGLTLGRDIDIEYTGVREGEKLFEELYYDAENTDRTELDGVFVCKLGGADGSFDDKMERLKRLAAEGNDAEVVSLLFDIVPKNYRENPHPSEVK